jgi:hypothetical protein
MKYELSIQIDDNDPKELMFDDPFELETKLHMDCLQWGGTKVFLFGDHGSYLDRKEYPIYRMIVNEEPHEIANYFRFIKSSTSNEEHDEDEMGVKRFFLQIHESYEDAISVMKDIICECSSSELRYAKKRRTR